MSPYLLPVVSLSRRQRRGKDQDPDFVIAAKPSKAWENKGQPSRRQGVPTKAKGKTVSEMSDQGPEDETEFCCYQTKLFKSPPVHDCSCQQSQTSVSTSLFSCVAKSDIFRAPCLEENPFLFLCGVPLQTLPKHPLQDACPPARRVQDRGGFWEEKIVWGGVGWTEGTKDAPKKVGSWKPEITTRESPWTFCYVADMRPSRHELQYRLLLSAMKLLPNFHPCRACRSAAVKFSPETGRENCHGKCVKFLVKFCRSSFLRKRSSKVPRGFHDQFHAIFHETFYSCKSPTSFRLFTLQTFVLDNSGKGWSSKLLGRCARVLRFMGREVQGDENSEWKLSNRQWRSYNKHASVCRAMSGREVTGG